MITLKHSQKTVVLKDFLTEKENRLFLQKIAAKMRVEDGKVVQDSSTADELIKYRDVLVELWVTEFDSSSENIGERMLDLRKEDYNQVLDAIREKNEEEEKKTV